MNKYDPNIVKAHIYFHFPPLYMSGITLVSTQLWFSLFVFICSVMVLSLLKYYSNLRHNIIAITGFYIYNAIAIALLVLKNHQYLSNFNSRLAITIVFLVFFAICQPIVRSIAISKATDYAAKISSD